MTSNPSASADIPNGAKLDWTNAFKKPIPESDPAQIPTLASSRNEDVEQWVQHNLHPQDRPKERNSSIVSLSSTGSCDMYSITDVSDDDEDPGFPPTTLSKATRKTIELVMRKIEVNLGYVAYVQCAGNQGSRGQGTSSNTSRAGRGAPQGSGGKRKARSDENSPPDDPGDEDSNKRRRVSITTTEDSESGPRFACPFYKHDPNRYRNRRTCPGPGWPTVHRMKEHLYRSHAQPIYCPRCYAMFDSDGDFSMHLRSHPCQISAPQPIEGIDRETLASLRKRSPALRLEEDKWRDTYQLLFPEVSAADIPSPCRFTVKHCCMYAELMHVQITTATRPPKSLVASGASCSSESDKSFSLPQSKSPVRLSKDCFDRSLGSFKDARTSFWRHSIPHQRICSRPYRPAAGYPPYQRREILAPCLRLPRPRHTTHHHSIQRNRGA